MVLFLISLLFPIKVIPVSPCALYWLMQLTLSDIYWAFIASKVILLVFADTVEAKILMSLTSMKERPSKLNANIRLLTSTGVPKVDGFTPPGAYRYNRPSL